MEEEANTEQIEAEESLRKLLKSSGFVVREEARESIVDRWGEDWEQELHSVAYRLSQHGKFSWTGDNDKWVISDREDILITTGDGRVLVAVYEVRSGPEIREMMSTGAFELSSWVKETIIERLDETAVSDAIDRIKEMAATCRIEWRNEPDLTKGGWRMALDGDVVFVNVSGTAVTKFQWRAMDHRDMVSTDDIRRYLARAGTPDGVRIGEKMRWRLDKAFGSLWESTMHDICIRASHDGEVTPNDDGNGFTVTLADEASMIVSRDGEVAVSVRIATSGSPEKIRSSILDGSIGIDSQAYGESIYYRSPARDAWMHYATCAAADEDSEIVANSTHWVLSSGSLKIFLSCDGTKITGVKSSLVDSADAACENVNRGAFWVWPSALEAGEVDSVDWYFDASPDEFRQTSRGWEWSKEGRPKVKLDKAAARVVALSKPKI